MKRVYYIVFFSGIILLLLPYCYTDKKAWHNGNMMPVGFDKLGRVDQVKYCAKCHQQEYQNELKGPHGMAYQQFLAHVAFVNSDKYDCAWYTAHVNEKKGECVSCHTPQNLFETVFKMDTGNRDPANNLLKAKLPFPPPRGVEERATSIDCISCHYDGHSVLATTDKPHQLFNSPACSPKGVALMGSNMSCYPCHWDAVKTVSADMCKAAGRETKCMSCHEQYDQNGKGTHYIYWKHDPVGTKNVLVERILDDLTAKVNKNGTAEITWLNTIMVHEMAPGPEMIWRCEILNKDSAVLGTKVIRVNHKKKIDSEMAEIFGTKLLGGVEGDVPVFDRSAKKYPFEIKEAESAKMVRITLIKKPQHWFPDSLGTVKSQRIINLEPAL